MKRSLKREVDDMGDLESPGGPPVPEAGGRNSEFSRNRPGVGVRWRWSTPSSGKKRCRPTAVPKFDGDGCRQQHLQIFSAIAKSNGWADETADEMAALQLLAQLEGEALNVALLMPEGSAPTGRDFRRVSQTIKFGDLIMLWCLMGRRVKLEIWIVFWMD